MTNQEILDMICSADVDTITYGDGLPSCDGLPGCDYLDAFITHLDDLLQDMPLPSLERPKIYPHEYLPHLIRLEEFMEEFMARDPHYSFWFSWMPLRSLLKRGQEKGTTKWANFVDALDAKVEREYPEERWERLKITWSRERD
jgi:hypothetical protein